MRRTSSWLGNDVDDDDDVVSDEERVTKGVVIHPVKSESHTTPLWTAGFSAVRCMRMH